MCFQELRERFGSSQGKDRDRWCETVATRAKVPNPCALLNRISPSRCAIDHVLSC